MKIGKVISGGQTGADRAALDAAIACGVPHGGWCPKGRRAEDGQIPAKYNLRETDSEEYSMRTKANVEMADLTLIFSRGPLFGGSLLTQEFAAEAGKPFIHIDLQKQENLHQTLQSAVEDQTLTAPVILNVAGPRASNDSGIYDAVYIAMIDFLKHFHL